MKTLLRTSGLAALMGLTAITANAQDYWTLAAEETYVTEPQEDVYYALQTGTTISNEYFCTTTGTAGNKNTTLTSECVFKLIKTGTTSSDGYDLWYIYNESSGSYLTDPIDTDYEISFTTYLADAGSFTILPAVTYDSGTEAETSSDYPRKCTTATLSDCVVICNSALDSSTPIYLCCYWYGNYSFYASYKDTNVWRICEVTEATGEELLAAVLAATFPNGLDSDKYPVGTSFGCYGEAEYNTADSLFNLIYAELGGDYSEEQYTLWANELQAAYDALIASFIEIEEGYFTLYNHTRPGYAYGNASTETILWSWETSYTLPENNDEFTADNAAYIWKFIATQVNGETYYYIQNYGTSLYAGGMSSLSTAIPLDEEPDDYFGIVSAGTANYFNIYDPQRLGSGYSWHAAVSGTAVVYWSSASDASMWTIASVDSSVIEGLDEQVVNSRRLATLSSLYATAYSSYIKSRSYTCADDIDNGYLDAVGLVTETSQLSCNAPDPSEGLDIGALLDGDFSTYFHSDWRTASAPATNHYLQADLLDAYDCIAFKMWRRANNTNGEPVNFTVYATNDTVNGAWVDCGTYDATFSYDELVNETGSDFIAVVYIEMPDDYRFVRMSVNTNYSGSTVNGFPFFALSEFRVYETEYASENSSYEAVSETTQAAFTAALASAAAALAAGEAAQTVIDELQTAYNAFLLEYADPDVLTSLIEDAMLYYDSAQVGTALGYYSSEEAKATFLSALETAQSKIADVMTIDEYNAIADEIDAALTAFDATLNKPEAGKYYYIACNASSNSYYNYRAYAVNNDSTDVRIGGYDPDAESYDRNMDYLLNYVWKVCEADEEGYFYLLNVATGTYLNNPHGETLSQGLKTCATPTPVYFRSARKPGALNIVLQEGIYANAYGTYLVTWNSASGDDNSAIVFTEVDPTDFECTYVRDLTSSSAFILTLPIAISGGLGTSYSVLGVNGTNLELQSYPDQALIPAATPFIYVPSDDEVNEGCITLYLDEYTSLDDIVYNFEPKEDNGMVGTLTSTTIPIDYGFLSGGMVYITTGNYTIAANSGYFNGQTTETSLNGDLTIAMEGTFTSIEEAVAALGTEGREGEQEVDVATMAGQLILRGVTTAEAMKTLAPGLYIIGNKKVYVK